MLLFCVQEKCHLAVLKIKECWSKGTTHHGRRVEGARGGEDFWENFTDCVRQHWKTGKGGGRDKPEGRKLSWEERPPVDCAENCSYSGSRRDSDMKMIGKFLKAGVVIYGGWDVCHLGSNKSWEVGSKQRQAYGLVLYLHQTWVCEKTVVMDNISYIFQERFFHDSPSFPGENNYLIQKQEN